MASQHGPGLCWPIKAAGVVLTLFAVFATDRVMEANAKLATLQADVAWIKTAVSRLELNTSASTDPRGDFRNQAN